MPPQLNFRRPGGLFDGRSTASNRKARETFLKDGETFFAYSCDCPTKPWFQSLAALRSHMGKKHPLSDLVDDRNRYAIVQDEAGKKSRIRIGADGRRLYPAPAHTDSATASTDPASS
eukprot:3935149-Rhodomonas_salina.1